MPKVSLLPNRIFQSERVVRDCFSTTCIARSEKDSMLNCASVLSRFSPDFQSCFSVFAHIQRCHLSVTSQPYVLVNETLKSLITPEAEQSVSFPGTERKTSQRRQLRVVTRCLHDCGVTCDHWELFTLLAQLTRETWVIFPATHDEKPTPC